MLAIKNNIMASNAARHLGKAYDSLSTSVERLSSGLRINSAKDDAAGLAVRELVRADIAVIQQGSRNAQDGISMLQTMEGAMGVIDDNLIRMKELAEQASTGSYSSSQRSIMNAEFSEMANEIDRIAGATTFNGIRMLTTADSTAAVSIHVGTTQTIDIARQDMRTSALGISTGLGNRQVTSDSGVNLLTDAFLTVNNTDNADMANALAITVQFTGGTADEDSFTINFSDAAAAGATSYSLQQVIDAINLKTQNLGKNDANGNSMDYGMASAFWDTNDNKYHLRLTARDATSTTVAISANAGSDAVVTTGFAAHIANAAFDGGLSIIDGGALDSFAAISAGNGVNISTADAAKAALTKVAGAITAKDTARAAFGYKMNRLESTISILDIQAENLNSAESRISDVDVATEMAAMTRTQVLAQAGISMLSQANTMPQMALSLLRG